MIKEESIGESSMSYEQTDSGLQKVIIYVRLRLIK